jgi:ectoine hydroxylase-related dioxygenase (phytanoyl-CoA dioxygenase family)
MDLNWHLDLSVPKKDELIGVQAFILIDAIQPRGGATLALAGSHRLHYLKTKNALTVLREDDTFSALFDGSKGSDENLLKPKLVSGIEVSVVEMSGGPGDVYLMDMRVLHSPSINSTKNIRMMATNRFFAHEV